MTDATVILCGIGTVIHKGSIQRFELPLTVGMIKEFLSKQADFIYGPGLIKAENIKLTDEFLLIENGKFKRDENGFILPSPKVEALHV